MGLFDKFKLPTTEGGGEVKNLGKNTIAGVAAASVLTAGTVGAADIKNLPSHNNLESEELHTEYVEKKPTPTLTEQTEKMGINIDPKTIPADGYNAADHTITKDGIIESIQPKQRVRKTSDAIPPEELTAKFKSLYSTDATPLLPLSESISQETHATKSLDGYQLDPKGTDTFVPAGGHSAQEALNTADQRDVDAVMQEETTSGIIEHGAEAPSEPITNNIDKTDETFPPEDSEPEKAPSPQSSEEINSKITTPNIPSDPEQLTELIGKTVETLAELLKKAPNMFTKKHFALLVPVLISSLNFNNTANAASLDDVYKDLNPDSTYTMSSQPKQLFSKTPTGNLKQFKINSQHPLSRINLAPGQVSLPRDFKKNQSTADKQVSGKITLPTSKYLKTSLGDGRKIKLKSNYAKKTISLPQKPQNKWQDDGSGGVTYTGPTTIQTTINTSGHQGDLDLGGVSSDRK
jgi:hypothetical protein